MYSSITRDKDKTFKVRDLWVEESVYSNITRDMSTQILEGKRSVGGRVCVQQHN